MTDRGRFIITPGYEELLETVSLASHESVLAYSGDDYAARSRTTSTVRVKVGNTSKVLFLKRYSYPKPLWKYAVRASRAEIEQRNLQWMRSQDIPAPAVIAWGEQRGLLHLNSCFIITLGVPEASNLDEFLPQYLQSTVTIQSIQQKRRAIITLAELLRRMHNKNFIDHDLYFRNILIHRNGDDSYAFSFIDSPRGGHCSGIRLRRGIERDLASLNKYARQFISRTDCLRFMCAYLDKDHLETLDLVLLQRIEKLSARMREKSRRQHMPEVKS